MRISILASKPTSGDKNRCFPSLPEAPGLRIPAGASTFQDASRGSHPEAPNPRFRREHRLLKRGFRRRGLDAEKTPKKKFPTDPREQHPHGLGGRGTGGPKGAQECPRPPGGPWGPRAPMASQTGPGPDLLDPAGGLPDPAGGLQRPAGPCQRPAGPCQRPARGLPDLVVL